MPTPRQEFDECPWNDYGYKDELPQVVAKTDGPHEVDRYALAALTRRVYTWHLKRTRAERLVVDDFLIRTHLAGLHTFYVRDPADDARTAVSIGTGDGVETVFSLPTTGEESRHYPRDDATLVVRVSGSPVTVASVDTDARTITLAAPPAASAPVEADYSGLRLVRQAAPFEWKGVSHVWYDCTIMLEEVITD